MSAHMGSMIETLPMPTDKRPPAAPTDPLSAYRAKRSVERTPEPAGLALPPTGAGGLFVVHNHAARRLHWCLRLQMDGVLRGGCVAQGQSPCPADKRLAVAQR